MVTRMSEKGRRSTPVETAPGNTINKGKLGKDDKNKVNLRK